MGEARAHFSDLVSRTAEEGVRYLIHNRGNPKAVVIGIDEYRDIEATLEEMSDPEAYRLLKEGNLDIEKGRTKKVEEIFGEALL